MAPFCPWGPALRPRRKVHALPRHPRFPARRSPRPCPRGPAWMACSPQVGFGRRGWCSPEGHLPPAPGGRAGGPAPAVLQPAPLTCPSRSPQGAPSRGPQPFAARPPGPAAARRRAACCCGVLARRRRGRRSRRWRCPAWASPSPKAVWLPYSSSRVGEAPFLQGGCVLGACGPSGPPGLPSRPGRVVARQCGGGWPQSLPSAGSGAPEAEGAGRGCPPARTCRGRCP